LAFLRKEKLLSILNTLLKDKEAVKHIGADGRKLIKILKEVRLKGYALNDEEFIRGVRAIAAPIFNAQGDVEGSVYMPIISQAKSQEESVERFAPLLIETARKISTARGLPAEAFGIYGRPNN
jgi:IclR family pca regulon transcriptional regulator